MEYAPAKALYGVSVLSGGPKEMIGPPLMRRYVQRISLVGYQSDVREHIQNYTDAL